MLRKLLIKYNVIPVRTPNGADAPNQYEMEVKPERHPRDAKVFSTNTPKGVQFNDWYNGAWATNLNASEIIR